MELKGKVHEVGETQQVSETFKKRDLIVEYAENPTYPEYIRFELMQDKCPLADSLKPGDEVEVFFNLRGRPWTDKTGKTSYFNSLVIWRLNAVASAEPSQATQQPAYAAPINIPAEEDNGDLPF
ncbi:MAG: DUF3127 domain-containing protein [Chryseobacterium sp.]|nr:MAG: DUF3127 domain-containing protein [Chryseobacterium sp.]